LGVSNILNELSLSLVMDSNLAFICSLFSHLFLKIPKYINTVQTSATTDVDWHLSAKLLLCYQKRFAMLHQNFTSNQSSVKIKLLLSAVKNNSLFNRSNNKEKTCNHRNENGWCNKSQRPCVAVNILFSKH
jgi:hypothetical protein